MTLIYTTKLDLTIQKTNIGAQKIHGLLLEIYGMASVRFLLQNSLGRVQFFEKTFLLADTSIKIILDMPFFSLSNVNIEFAELEKLIRRTYIATETISTTSQVELID